MNAGLASVERLLEGVRLHGGDAGDLEQVGDLFAGTCAETPP